MASGPLSCTVRAQQICKVQPSMTSYVRILNSHSPKPGSINHLNVQPHTQDNPQISHALQFPSTIPASCVIQFRTLSTHSQSFLESH